MWSESKFVRSPIASGFETVVIFDLSGKFGVRTSSNQQFFSPFASKASYPSCCTLPFVQRLVRHSGQFLALQPPPFVPSLPRKPVSRPTTDTSTRKSSAASRNCLDLVHQLDRSQRKQSSRLVLIVWSCWQRCRARNCLTRSLCRLSSPGRRRTPCSSTAWCVHDLLFLSNLLC